MTIYDLAAETEEIIWVPNALSIHRFSKIIADYLLVFFFFVFFFECLLYLKLRFVSVLNIVYDVFLYLV